MPTIVPGCIQWPDTKCGLHTTVCYRRSIRPGPTIWCLQVTEWLTGGGGNNDLFVSSSSVTRYAFGIVICSLSLVTIVVALAGVVMGMCGFRKNKDPDQRSNLSHCGGIFLLLWVARHFPIRACSLLFTHMCQCIFNCHSPTSPSLPPSPTVVLSAPSFLGLFCSSCAAFSSSLAPMHRSCVRLWKALATLSILRFVLNVCAIDKQCSSC